MVQLLVLPHTVCDPSPPVWFAARGSLGLGAAVPSVVPRQCECRLPWPYCAVLALALTLHAALPAFTRAEVAFGTFLSPFGSLKHEFQLIHTLVL